MDSLTQAALGAAIGEATLGKSIGDKGAILGALVATIPDLDVLLTPFFSELQKVSIHRGFSHSLLFCFLLTFLLLILFRKLNWTREIEQWRLWWFGFLALLTHVLLDTFTTYGTQLFLPFSERRVGWDSINIVDPFYTVPLLIGLALVFFKYQPGTQQRRNANYVGLLISSSYLLFTLVNKQQVEQVFELELQRQQITHKELLTVPVGIGNISWYSVAKADDDLFIGQYSRINSNRIVFERFPINDHLLADLDPFLVDRMRWFSKGFYTVAEREGVIRIYNMQCDMQGIRQYGDYKAPTAFYFEIDPSLPIGEQLNTGMHPKTNW